MIRLALCLFLMTGGFAMAKDGNVQVPSSDMSKSPQDQVADRIVEALRNGDYDTAAREYEAGQKLFGWQPRTSAAPLPSKSTVPSRTMTLPPEAR